MRVLGIPTDNSGVGCYRLLWPLAHMREHGLHETFHPPATEFELPPLDDVPGWARHTRLDFAITREQMRQVDVVVVQTPFRPDQKEVMDLAYDEGCAVVLDFDDWHYDVPEDNRTARFYTDDVLERGREMARLADMITVSTPELAERYVDLNPNVRLLRNRAERRLWAKLAPKDWDRPRIGWMGNHHWHPGAVEIIRDCVVPWLVKNPDVEFVAAGDLELHDLVGTPWGQRLSLPPTSVHDIATLMRFDVGIVPLERSLFNDCKSYLKGLEYASCGIPFVASPSREYVHLYGMWGTDMIAAPNDSEAWAWAIDKQFDALPEISARLQAHASDEDISWHWGEWAIAYREAYECTRA